MLFELLPAESFIRPVKTCQQLRVRSLVPRCFTWGLMRSVINQERLALQLCDDIIGAVPLSPGKGSSTLRHLTWARLWCQTQQVTPDQPLQERGPGPAPVMQQAGTDHDCLLSHKQDLGKAAYPLCASISSTVK